IPFFGGQSASQMQVFAQRIQDSLYKVINERTKGIIVDLRLNAGGNMFPMIAGLSNVLGETDFAIYPKADNSGFERSTITREGVAVNGTIITGLPRTYGDLSAHPVAVILGPVTGSAGECVAAAFVGRGHTIFVGENTAGFTTANDGFRLSGDDYGMVLAVGYLRDRYANIYYDDIKPDIRVIGGDDFFNPENDKKIQAAVNWIGKQYENK
ncbi:MAG TPA: S41 family peptidase, partial [Ferruginibacter sp.]|nr:S41 family peptidase [Ferruginibacter sp.]